MPKPFLIATLSAATLLMALPAAATPAGPITLAEIEAAQASWGAGIVAIGQAADPRAAADAHIRAHYAFGQTPVLFKPTLASVDPFRGTFDEALSYFVGGGHREDSGFALAPWTSVRFANDTVSADTDSALAMGTYWFGRADGSETRVEYTLGYVRAPDGTLRINLQHSSLPAPAPAGQ